MDRNLRSRVRFTTSEDRVLYHLVVNREFPQWGEIAKMLPGRNSRQCRDRWNHYLTVRPTERPWTSEEDLLLTQVMRLHTSNWKKISKLFWNRSESEVYRRWLFRSTRHKDASEGHPGNRERSQTESPLNPPDENDLEVAMNAPFDWQTEEASTTKSYD
jgi:hypothetical protein